MTRSARLRISETLEELQRRVCKAYGAEYVPPAPGTKVGIALQTMGRTPVSAVRLKPTETTCGWFIFAGAEWSDDADFYQPLCVEHLPDYCESALPFLALPPGWRFHTDGQKEYGASFDPTLLQT
jgi:hypothetical protein